MHISPDRLQGSLSQACIEQLLETCHKQLITCSIKVNSPLTHGVIEVRSGTVEDAQFGDKTGKDAISAMNTLAAGEFELNQLVLDMTGSLGTEAFAGHTSEVELITVMRHCEENALSCIIEVHRETDEVSIHYRVGELSKVFFNGERDDDRIVDIMNCKDASFRVLPPPLDLHDWPVAAPKVAEVPVAQKQIVVEDRTTPRNTGPRKPAPAPVVAGEIEIATPVAAPVARVAPRVSEQAALVKVEEATPPTEANESRPHPLLSTPNIVIMVGIAGVLAFILSRVF